MKYLLTLITVFILNTSMAQSYKVIVNKSNSISTISKDELSDIFFKKDKSFENGQKAYPVDQKGSSQARKGFSSEILGKSVASVKSFWQQSVFQGKSTPPVEKGSDQEVVRYVANNPGAIGYVSGGTSTSSVKTIKVN